MNKKERTISESNIRLKERKEEESYISQGYKEEQEEFTDLVEMHFIELPKFIKKDPGVNEKIEQWLWLLRVPLFKTKSPHISRKTKAF